MTPSQWLGIVGAFLAIVGPGLTSLGVPWAFASTLATFGSYLAFRADGQRPAPKEPPTPSDQRGRAAVIVLAGLAALTLAAGLLMLVLGAGCASVDVHAKTEARFKWRPRPTCDFRAFADGEEVFHLEGAKPCDPPPEVCPASTFTAPKPLP